VATPSVAAVPNGGSTIVVTGSPLSSITTSSPALVPAFSQSTHDYVVRCQAGVNPITVTLTAVSGGTIQVGGGQSGPTATITLPMLESQPAVVQAPDPNNQLGPPREYWVRCLPHDFPLITVNKPGNPSPGWYLTSTIGSAGQPGLYAMILDSNGTPVWYAPTPKAAFNVQLLPNNTLAWSPFSGPGIGSDPSALYSLYQLDTQTTQFQPTPNRPMDFHELLQLSNGNRMLIATPLKTGLALPSSFSSTNGAAIDCIIDEVDPDGNLVWSWDALNHVAPSENMIASVVIYNGQPAADLYHCNSIDVDPSASNPSSADVLVSIRQADAVVRINRANPQIPNGKITWKLGGSQTNLDGAQILSIQNDPETTIYGQHDARFQPGGDVSMYDNHTGQAGAARGVEYNINTTAGTATSVFQFLSPDGLNAVATGSFRRYDNGADRVIGWGSKTGIDMSEVDGSGNVLFDLTMDGTAYRFVKVPLAAIDVNLLRQSAGLSVPPPHNGVVMDGWGGLHPYGTGHVNTSGFAYWQGWDIARGVAMRADATGGYTVDGYGGVHPFGDAPAVSFSAYWSGWDIARGIALCANGTSGYTLDGWGGVHGFGGAPAVADNTHAYWPWWDIARGIVVKPDCTGGYVLDGWGGIHAFGNTPSIADTSHAYWFRWDIARAAVLRSDGQSGYTLDGWGGIHAFGGAPPVEDTSHTYWQGWDIARSINLSADDLSGYTLDGWGGVHAVTAPGGQMPPAVPDFRPSSYWQWWDIARGTSGS
jgi:hypothetical protein